MIDTLQNILAVIVVLGLLVTFHEFGHFWVARRCGVKVLRFSVGFGKPLLIRRDRSGTEFAVSVIPLGGYVKMLDEREGPVAPEALSHAFNRKSVWQRFAIVAAGPIANFLLAIVAYWALFIYGTTTAVPLVGVVTPDSPAAIAGLKHGQEITAVEGESTPSWGDVNLKLLSAIGQTGELVITTREGSRTKDNPVTVKDWLVRQDPPEPLKSLGITPWRPDVPAVIGQLVEGHPAAESGLQTGDIIQAVDGRSVANWLQFVEYVQQKPNELIELDVKRNGQSLSLNVTPETKPIAEGQQVGYIGAGAAPVSWPEEYKREIHFGPLEAILPSVKKTAEMSWLTVDSIRKMIVGWISPSNLSGPITIARVAGDSARNGVETFVGFLAYLSISLGVLNLLPIPMLDGGHLVYYLIEIVRGRPVSEKMQTIGLKIGMVLVGGLMFFALYFDLMRL